MSSATPTVPDCDWRCQKGECRQRHSWGIRVKGLTLGDFAGSMHLLAKIFANDSKTVLAWLLRPGQAPSLLVSHQRPSG
jgi:hypothetical protein